MFNKKAKIFVGLMWSDIPMKVLCQARLDEIVMRPNRFYELGKKMILEGSSLVSWARYQLSKDFLESDCTHLLFVDSDAMIMNMSSIEQLLENNKPIVSGLFTSSKIGKGIKPTYKPFDPELLKRYLDGEFKDHLLPVESTGMHFTLIKREVVKYLLNFDPENLNPFEPRLYKGEYHGEDGMFCKRASELYGYKTYVDLRVMVGHVGEYCFTPYDWLIQYNKRRKDQCSK